MGNAGSSTVHMHRERHKSADLSTPSSPAHFRDSVSSVGAGAGGTAAAASGGVGTGGGSSGSGGGGGGQAFSFDKKHTAVLTEGSSQEDDDEYFTRAGAKRTADNETTTAAAVAATTSADREQTMDENNDGELEKAIGALQLTDEEFEVKKTALPTVLRWDYGGKNVTISGTFSKWKPIPMVRSHGNFVTIIDLAEGDHQYKFCVDGEWKHDPKLKSVENDEGDKNNLVSVRASDFEVFQALAKDSENVPNYAEKEYSQEVPQVKPWEKVSGPPVLPPHLLQVILNKDTPLSCEPTLLPEPNHVMLNHLYALSIKDGVMVLSATHRYCKKYVTTLLYKPI
ncbi:5'-AMP-activated protein kinase subunit beta-1 [Drosophila grimshawi]|uniref:5'-AMP-activated protein kinase subunit beta-1 n=1 Tax=Drosophila grimshawi TaxID=7222 RepID=B4J3V2_DROGR|nr:5'-AMP-activated protein kinase subunit beta-1 [Drosophila grimshawi]EDW01535.1 GH21488 [Drosophila grimshawi]